MSKANQAVGYRLYYEDDLAEREWFERQWKIWPERAHQDRTTNVSFHYGGVCAFREINGRDPAMSKDFASHVAWHDRHKEPHP